MPNVKVQMKPKIQMLKVFVIGTFAIDLTFEFRNLELSKALYFFKEL